MKLGWGLRVKIVTWIYLLITLKDDAKSGNRPLMESPYLNAFLSKGSSSGMVRTNQIWPVINQFR